MNEKKKGSKVVIIAVLGFIILILVSFIIALNNVGLLKIDVLKNLGTTKKAELTYTTTNNKIKEGIYITDVSEIVEEVMPSIVAITSKTLVTSGYYGPFYNNGNTERYSTGAGSGIIISKTDDELLILTNNHVVEDSDELFSISSGKFPFMFCGKSPSLGKSPLNPPLGISPLSKFSI